MRMIHQGGSTDMKISKLARKLGRKVAKKLIKRVARKLDMKMRSFR